MIAAIDRKDIPPQGGRERSPMRKFAFGAVGEFLEAAREGDVYEVTGWPDVPAESSLQRAAKAVSALDTELWHFGAKDIARVYRRRERVFLERKAPKPQPTKTKGPWKWPDDFPEAQQTNVTDRV